MARRQKGRNMERGRLQCAWIDVVQGWWVKSCLCIPHVLAFTQALASLTRL